MKKLLVALSLLLLAACAAKDAPDNFNPANHFLGQDYVLLTPKPELQGGLGWRSPDFNPQQYKALYIEPVILWRGEDMSKQSGLAMDDLNMLATYLHDVLKLVPSGKPLALAPRPGPGVITVQAAVTDVETSSPVSNALTSVIPVGILLSAGKQLATGKAIGVGKCSVEVKFVDSMSGKKLALFADTKIGKKYSMDGFKKTGQTEEAMREWSELLKQRINALWAS